MKSSIIKDREIKLKIELERIVKIIINEYNPEKIVLFGSLVHGKIHEWSDIDLLIIKKTNKRPIERCVEIASLIHPKIGIDIFVYTPDEYKLLLKEKYTLLTEILKQGKILYEKRK